MIDDHRFEFALEHVTDKSVFVVERADWEGMILHTGKPTRLVNIPTPIAGLVSMAAHVMAAGSGIYNASPGIDVVRFDPADDPCVYNLDHYTVFEHFASSPLYPEALRVAGIEDSEELRGLVELSVFVVGPYQQDNHHEEEIPQQIREAKHKR